MVGAREHIVKSRRFGRMCTGLKHFRRVGSDRRFRYLNTFEKKYAKLKELLDVARIFLSVRELLYFTNRIALSTALAIIDDKLYEVVEIEPKIREGSPKPRYMKNLITIANNLANYFRILLKNNPKKFREKLRRFEK